MDPDLGLVQIEAWKRFGWLRHGFSTRAGGASMVYGDGGALNLGWTPEDDPAVVAENRRRLVEAVGGGSLGMVSGEIRLDLWEANRRQLLEAGVAKEKISVVGECSGCAVDGAGRRRYFSHRVDKGVTGRMMSVVGVV